MSDNTYTWVECAHIASIGLVSFMLVDGPCSMCAVSVVDCAVYSVDPCSVIREGADSREWMGWMFILILKSGAVKANESEQSELI